jgi:hypothetical protein
VPNPSPLTDTHTCRVQNGAHSGGARGSSHRLWAAQGQPRATGHRLRHGAALLLTGARLPSLSVLSDTRVSGHGGQGGGTLDVALLRLELRTRTFLVLAAAGDPHLGGEDFDRALAKHLESTILPPDAGGASPCSPSRHVLADSNLDCPGGRRTYACVQGLPTPPCCRQWSEPNASFRSKTRRRWTCRGSVPTPPQCAPCGDCAPSSQADKAGALAGG